MHPLSNQSAGTVGGTFLAFVGVLDLGDMLKTAVLAAVGAIVSYVVSAAMKRIFSRQRKNNDPQV